MTATFREIETRTVDGVTLRIDHVVARGAGAGAGAGERQRQGQRRGAVVCLHAMMTDGRYFGARRDDGFAAALAEDGLDVFVADFRGHGRSVPPYARGGRWSFDDLVELDLPAIVAAAAEAYGCSAGELAILGHSLGGLVACAAIATGRIPPPRRVGLAATSVWLGETRVRKAIMRVYRGVAQVVGYAPIRALRLGTADESAGYVDQLTGWARTGRWTSRTGIDYSEALADIRVPAFAVSGAGDWMCRPADAERITSRIATCERLRVVGRRHGDAIDPDHFELFTSRELLSVWREVSAKLAT